MVHLVDPQAAILAEVADQRMTRDDVALTYAFAIRQQGDERFDWSLINRAIMGRWSMAGLTYVKNQAWRLIEGRS